MQLRLAVQEDFEILGEVMFDAVRNGRSHYSEAQRKAWVPEPRAGHAWHDRLNQQSILIGENANKILGFMSLAFGGYIDFAYIRPCAQGSGLFHKLYDGVESLALGHNEPLLWTHASLMAQPAFSAMGYSIRKKQEVKIGDETFSRFEMEKNLNG